MASVRPLINNNGNLREMSDSEMSDTITYCAELYRNNPTVTLSNVVVGGNLGTFYDTRLTAGGVSISTGNQDASDNGADEFPQESETQEPQVVTVAWSAIGQSIDSSPIAPSDIDDKAFPVYYDGNNIKSMTLTDMYDTFIKDAITEVAPDIYYVHNAPTLSGYTSIGVAPIFSDTGADLTQYQASSIPEDSDQPITRNSFYLFEKDFTLRDSAHPPVRIQEGVGNNLRTMLDSDWRVMLEKSIRYASVNLAGSRIQYGVNTGGTDCGSFYDDRLNGTGNYQTRFIDVDEYRAQEFPNGDFVRINTYTLQSRLDT